jgi:hypothetical protein
VSGQALSPVVELTLLDQYGRWVDDDNDTVVTASLPGSGILLGQLTARARYGKVQFGGGADARLVLFGQAKRLYAVNFTATIVLADGTKRFATAAVVVKISGCAAGLYSDPGTQRCLPCPAGSSSPDNNLLSACVPCATGRFQLKPGSPSCTRCEPGSALSTTGSLLPCAVCTAGTFAARHNSSLCAPCPAGRWSASNATVCRLCAVGTHNEFEGQASCVGCSAGSYIDKTGQSACLPVSPVKPSLRRALTSSWMWSYLCSVLRAGCSQRSAPRPARTALGATSRRCRAA